MYISIIHNIQYRKIIMANIVIDRYTFSSLCKITYKLYLRIQRTTISCNQLKRCSYYCYKILFTIINNIYKCIMHRRHIFKAYMDLTL